MRPSPHSASPFRACSTRAVRARNAAVTVYAIGDVQGCERELRELLGKLRFKADRDRLWFVGDLVNRGPASLGVLRRVRALSANAVTVLGNHDLHLVAVALGEARFKQGDTLRRVLKARDCDPLIEWLAALPLLHEDPARSLAMVHAGLPPQWSLAMARARAREVELALRADPRRFVARMYGNQPRRWSQALRGSDRLRFITNCFTRLRYLTADGGLDMREKNAPARAAPGLTPWFARRDARWRGTRIVFGHWSSLGFLRNRQVIALDTGCVWGGRLTAVSLDDPERPPISVLSHEPRRFGD